MGTLQPPVVRDEPNLLMALVGGAAAAGLGAIVWAVISVVTDYQYSIVAIGIGFVVGLAVRYFGRGTSLEYGLIGAVFALLGCLAGNLLIIAIVLSGEENVSLVEMMIAMAVSPLRTLDVMVATFQPLDLLFYALAVFEGFRFARRR
jgi:hypothetical protein